MIVNPMQEFITYLLEALETIVVFLGRATVSVEGNVISVLDLTMYGAIIGLTLSFIREHYSSSGYGRDKITYKKRSNG